MTASALATRDLHVSLGGRPVLAGLDLALEPGALTIVIGPNGAGKTTLLRALAGLASPGSGAALLDGGPVHLLPRGVRAKNIAYLPQGGSVAWPLSVERLVALGRMPHGEPTGALPEGGRRAVASALALVGLAGFEGRAATELSGGERARVLLARALATEGPILLADEPVAALDPRHQLLVLEGLRRRARAGATIVAVMHDLALAARFADQVVLLGNGRLVATGSPSDVLTPARLAAAFGIEARVDRQGGELMVTPWRVVPDAEQLR